MFENVVCEMSAILSRPQCVNKPCTLTKKKISGWVTSSQRLPIIPTFEDFLVARLNKQLNKQPIGW